MKHKRYSFGADFRYEPAVNLTTHSGEFHCLPGNDKDVIINSKGEAQATRGKMPGLRPYGKNSFVWVDGNAVLSYDCVTGIVTTLGAFSRNVILTYNSKVIDRKLVAWSQHDQEVCLLDMSAGTEKRWHLRPAPLHAEMMQSGEVLCYFLVNEEVKGFDLNGKLLRTEKGQYCPPVNPYHSVFLEWSQEGNHLHLVAPESVGVISGDPEELLSVAELGDFMQRIRKARAMQGERAVPKGLEYMAACSLMQSVAFLIQKEDESNEEVDLRAAVAEVAASLFRIAYSE